jgi:hypothetical protein
MLEFLKKKWKTLSLHHIFLMQLYNFNKIWMNLYKSKKPTNLNFLILLKIYKTLLLNNLSNSNNSNLKKNKIFLYNKQIPINKILKKFKIKIKIKIILKKIIIINNNKMLKKVLNLTPRMI